VNLSFLATGQTDVMKLTAKFRNFPSKMPKNGPYREMGTDVVHTAQTSV